MEIRHDVRNVRFVSFVYYKTRPVFCNNMAAAAVRYTDRVGQNARPRRAFRNISTSFRSSAVYGLSAAVRVYII